MNIFFLLFNCNQFILRNKGPISIIRFYYVMIIILVFLVFTTRVHTCRWQKQFVCILFNPMYEYCKATSYGVSIKQLFF